MTTSKVYVVQEVPGRNLSSAQDFGQLQLMLRTGQTFLDPDHTVKVLHRHLHKYTSDDYILLIGDPVAIGIATALASHYNNGHVNVLKWDRQYQLYNEVRLIIR